MPSLRNLHKLLDPEIRAKNLRAMRFAMRGLYWDLVRSQATDPVFVVGCSRSGTTVTYETIAMSPRLLSFGHEIPEFWDSLWGPRTNGWESEAAGAEVARPEHRDAAQRYFFQRLGLGRVVDKTCINVMRVPYLYRLFPQARFVYIHRDGRDNVSSLMDGWLYDGHFALRSRHRRRFLQSNGFACATRISSTAPWKCFAKCSTVWSCPSTTPSDAIAPRSTRGRRAS